MRKLSLAIVHGHLGRGGSEAAVMWGTEALKRDFSVSIVTIGPVDLEALNRFYGTAVAPDEITVRSLPSAPFFAGLRAGDAMRGAWAQRVIRAVAPDYDVLISAYGACDFGKPGIHLIADLSWDEELRPAFDPAPGGLRGVFHRLAWLRRTYLGIANRVARPSGRDLFSGQDLITANSQWTAEKLRDRYGVFAPVIYPPVTDLFKQVPFEHRSHDFVCIGRIDPQKRIERMISILRRVRASNHSIRLRIVGALDSSPYAKRVESLARANSEWVRLQGLQHAREKTELLARCRYGIHARAAEPFGIAVAEMVKAGCITFAPNDGGQVEILDHPTLLYRDENDAVEKIATVLADSSLRTKLLNHLRMQGDKFSNENFMRGLRASVDEFLSGSFAGAMSEHQLAGSAHTA
jgi:glycosyltransferase involved in cell wall biosynthesis